MVGCCGPVANDQATVTVLACFESGLADCFVDAQCTSPPVPPGLLPPFRFFGDRIQAGLQRVLDTCLATPFPAAGQATRLFEVGGIFKPAICSAANTFPNVPIFAPQGAAACGYESLNFAVSGPSDVVAYAYKTKAFRSATERYCFRDSTQRTLVTDNGVEEINIVTTLFPAANTVEALPEMPPLITPCDGPPWPNIGPFIKACRRRQEFRKLMAFESAPGLVCVFP